MRTSVVLFIAMLMLAGCVKIPQQSVELSESIGQMMLSAKTSHVNMVNRHFDFLTKEVKEFAFGEYKDKFLSNTLKIAQSRNPSITQLTFTQYDLVIERIQKKQDVWINQVDDNRKAVLKALDEHYILMTQSNSELTSLLRSAAKLNETRNNILNSGREVLGLTNFNIEQVESKLLNATEDIRKVLNNDLIGLNNN